MPALKPATIGQKFLTDCGQNRPLTTIKPQKDVKGLEGRLNLPKHMAEHIYMLCGDSVNATIKTDVGMMDTLVDWFGRDFRIVEKNEDEIVFSVKCNESALLYWSLQYGPSVEVLGPDYFRDRVADEVEAMAKKYGR